MAATSSKALSQYGPITSDILSLGEVLTAIICAVETARRSSHWSSTVIRLIFSPLSPPRALMSSTAMRTPEIISSPKLLYSPAFGAMTATFTSAEAAAGSNKLRTEIIFKKVLDIKSNSYCSNNAVIIAKLSQNATKFYLPLFRGLTILCRFEERTKWQTKNILKSKAPESTTLKT